MEPNDEYSQKLTTLHEAQAQSELYLDLDNFLKKYEEKLNRLYNQAQKEYSRLKKSGITDKALNNALRLVVQLQYLQLAQHDFRIEMLQRSTEAQKALKTANEDLIALLERLNQEDASETE